MSDHVSIDPPVMGIKEIMEILPHRYPFLLVDAIVSLDLEEGKIVGQKNVTINENFFNGHFPGAPIMPGVLILEALAQTGALLLHKKMGHNKIPLLLNANTVKFRRPVHPGNILYLHAFDFHVAGKAGKIKGEAYVNNKMVTQAEIGFALADKEQV